MRGGFERRARGGCRWHVKGRLHDWTSELKKIVCERWGAFARARLLQRLCEGPRIADPRRLEAFCVHGEEPPAVATRDLRTCVRNGLSSWSDGEGSESTQAFASVRAISGLPDLIASSIVLCY